MKVNTHELIFFSVRSFLLSQAAAMTEIIAEEEEAERLRLALEEEERVRLEDGRRRKRQEEEEELKRARSLRRSQLKDGIMFFQPMDFSADINYDPFDARWYEWHGKGHSGSDTARSSQIEEDEIPSWMKKDEGIKVFRNTMGHEACSDEYKEWPHIYETTRVLWHEYFVNMEKRVLFPLVSVKSFADFMMALFLDYSSNRLRSLSWIQSYIGTATRIVDINGEG